MWHDVEREQLERCEFGETSQGDVRGVVVVRPLTGIVGIVANVTVGRQLIVENRLGHWKGERVRVRAHCLE